jgi:tRNA (guanine-N7-)-methyltransferase
MSMKPARGKVLDVGEIGRGPDDLPPIADSPEQTRFDFRAWWPEDRRSMPFELEIGSGKGTFLVQQAGALPDVNYLGVEYAGEFARYAADRLRRNGLTNVRLLAYDAAVFVRWFCPDRAFRQVHIYFPDPWPKKRHHKRRIVQAPFLAELHRVLAADGVVRIVTDHDDYFAWMNEHIARAADLFEVRPFERPIGAGDGEVVGTNFERKYRREGRPFNAVSLAKR